MPRKEPLYPHVPKSREPVYPRASPHMRAAPVTPEVIDVSGLNKAIEMHRDWLAIPKKEIPGFPLLTREDFTGLIGEKRFILKAIEANKNLDKALQLVNEYLNEHRFLLSRGVEAQGGWSQGKWVEYYGNLKKQLERKVAIPKAEAAPVTPEVTMPKPTRPLIEAEKPAVAEYYRKEAQKWRDIADKEVLTEPSKEGEARFSFAIQKAEAFEKAASELTEFIAAFGRSYAKAFAGIPNAPLTHHIGLRGIAGELGMDFNSPAFKNRVEKMVKEGTLRFAPTREAKDNLLIRMPGLLHEQSIGLVAKRPVAKVTPTWGDVLPSTKKPFIKVGERVRFIGSSRGRYETWPKDAWLEKGVIGTVKEYHPEQPAVRAGGEYFEALPPYAVVRWDFGGNTVIDPDDEGERWERIHHEKSPS